MTVQEIEKHNSDQEAINKLIRLARIPRLYRLLRILRLFKLIRVFKYSRILSSFLAAAKMNAGISRMLKVIATIFLSIHLMTCFWFLVAKLNDFNEGTWVSQMGLIGASRAQQYLVACNWSL